MEDDSKNSLQDKSSQTNANTDHAYNRDNNNTQEDTHNLNASRQEAPSTRQKPNIGFVVIPYTKGISESCKKICGKYGIQTCFRGNTTIKQLLMKPKDRDPKDQKSGMLYSYQCGDITCGKEYIVETSRTLGERHKEHLKQPPPIHAHIQQTGYNPTTNNFNIIGRTRAWPGPSRKASS